MPSRSRRDVRAKKAPPSQSGKPPNRPRDPFQLTKLIGDITTGRAPRDGARAASDTGKNPAAVALGRLGGLKGGKARAKSLSATKRKAIAKKAAKARWGRPT